MLRIDWSDRPAVKLGIIAAFLLSTGSIWWAIDYGWSQEAAYEEGARKGYAERAKHGCYEVANSKPATTAIKQPNAKPCTESKNGVEENDNRRDYADLVAQRSSALWAKIMGIAAVVGVALSLLGIALVAITFRETRLANSIAKETLFRQLRAYVTVESLVDERMGGGMSITLHNSGATPARGVKVVYDKLQVSDGVLSYVETEIKVADIGSQARKSITLEWYTWRDIFDAKLKIPTTLSGLLIYQPVVPDEKGCNPVLVEPFIIDLSDSEYKGDLKVEITRLPPNTRFA
jgi:hypothetical protein